MSVSIVWKCSSPTGAFENSHPRPVGGNALCVRVEHVRDDGSIDIETLRFNGVYAYGYRVFEILTLEDVKRVYNAVVDLGESEWLMQVRKALDAQHPPELSGAMRHLQMRFDLDEPFGKLHDIACLGFESTVVRGTPPTPPEEG